MSANINNPGYVVACSIIENIHQTLGVQLLPLFNSYALTDKEKISKASVLLIDAIFLRAANNNYSWFVEDESEFTLDKAPDFEPNITISESDSLIISNLEGEKVSEYVYTLTKRLENLSNSKSVDTLVMEMILNGIKAVGTQLAVKVGKELYKGVAMKAAIGNSIASLGAKTVYGVIAMALAQLVFYLFSTNAKKIVGVVANNTDETLKVENFLSKKGNLYMRHGTMVSFMDDYDEGKLLALRIQIGKRVYLGKGNKDNMVQLGIYTAEKNFGLRGTEGLMVFNSTSKQSNLKFAHLFAVPYSKDNRTNMAYLTNQPKDLDQLFQQLYDANKVRVNFKQEGYRFTSTVNNPRGGVVACIATISKE